MAQNIFSSRCKHWDRPQNGRITENVKIWSINGEVTQREKKFGKTTTADTFLRMSSQCVHVVVVGFFGRQ